MKPSAFEYLAPTSLDEALEAVTQGGDDAKPLAGGQSLVPLMAFRLAVFGQLVDLNRIDELQGVRREGEELVIGAVTRQRAIETDETVRSQAPLLAKATGLIGHVQIRNRGTIGGSLSHADPAAEYPAVAVALDATLDIASTSGRRRTPAAELFDSAYMTTMQPDELIVGVRVPVRVAGDGFAIHEVSRRHGDFALAGCAARVRAAGPGAVSVARVVLFGVGGAPVRLDAAEQALTAGSDPGSPEFGDVLREAAGALDPPEDALATSRYRRSVAAHVARRAIADALADSHDQGGTA
jgi:carbon-monoxide dehydrogenase medium subunit